MNLYQGMNMNPVNFVDPTGEYFYVPKDDPNKERILYALAAGSFTSSGGERFWKCFNDNIKIVIHSGDLQTDVKSEHYVKRQNNLSLTQTYGSVDGWASLSSWPNDKRIREVDVTISFRNLDAYYLLKKRFDYVFLGQGNLDSDGITTIYHELEHVSDILTLDLNLDKISAYQKILEGDYKSDESGKILEKKYSPKSRAQRFGEKVYKQTKAIGDDELKKKLKSVVAIIRSKMIEMENNSETK